jgi:hypothetical protein
VSYFHTEADKISTHLQRLKENAENLKIRPHDFGSMLQEIGFQPAQHFGVTGSGGMIFVIFST